MGDFKPGERVKKFFSSSGGKVDAVVGNAEFSNINMPSSPGPKVAGRTPAIGSIRRERDIPVVRDELPELLG